MRSGVIALIPARGGSKGVPRKNIRLLGGKPLLEWTIEIAKKCPSLTKVVLSTDDEEIAEIGRRAGAEVPFLRPAKLAQDNTPDFPVFEHAVKWLAENQNFQADMVVWLRPTAPLRTIKDIEGALKLLQSSKASAVRSVCPVEHHPYWMKRMQKNKLIAFVSGKDESKFFQRQSLPSAFRLNGAVDVVRVAPALKNKKLFGGEVLGFAMPVERSLDLDTELDFQVAEMALGKKTSAIKPVKIAGRPVGSGHPCFVIAEAGVNHNGDMALALRLIDEAKKAGADAVKFQSFVTEDLITPDAPKAGYQVVNTGKPGSQYEMLKKLELTAEQQAQLKKHCDKAEIIYLCTPYEKGSVDRLDRLDVAAYKIASTDTTNIPFLRHVASKKRPVILSTGMCELKEVKNAVDALNASGLRDNFVLLHCTSEYPVPMSDINLRAMNTLAKEFRCVVGFSDHTTGTQASPWSVAMGASVVEKHFTLDRSLPGPDHRASLEPAELAAMIKAIREVEIAMGDGVKRVMPSEAANKSRMQKSLVALKEIKKGELITEDLLVCKRPGVGLDPSWWDRVIGRRAATDIKREAVLNHSDIQWGDKKAVKAS